MSASRGEGEPIVAHGARMSWAGLLRPGDEFPPIIASRLGVLTEESGRPLRRFFGSWSARYRRFTSNLSTARVQAEVAMPGRLPDRGIDCVIHWVAPRALRELGPGSVCAGDGWPSALWKAFTSEIDSLPPGSLAEKLRAFRDGRRQGRTAAVAEWREALREGRPRSPAGAWPAGGGWIPVPATLRTQDGTTTCIVSWDPYGREFPSLSDALRSPDDGREPADLGGQARYYLECTLARLHGVRFGPRDALRDREFARSPEVRKLAAPLRRLERERIASSRFGRLGRRDAPAPSAGPRHRVGAR